MCVGVCDCRVKMMMGSQLFVSQFSCSDDSARCRRVYNWYITYSHCIVMWLIAQLRCIVRFLYSRYRVDNGHFPFLARCEHLAHTYAYDISAGVLVTHNYSYAHTVAPTGYCCYFVVVVELFSYSPFNRP